MSLPGKQNRDQDERLVPHVPTWQSVECEKVGLRNSGTAEVAKFSRLSARMVELSLQQAQRDPTLHDAFPAKLNAVSSPLPWPSTFAAPRHPSQPRGTPRESKIPNYWKEVRCNLDYWLARTRVSGSAAVRNLCQHAKSAQKFAVSSLESGRNCLTVLDFYGSGRALGSTSGRRDFRRALLCVYPRYTATSRSKHITGYSGDAGHIATSSQFYSRYERRSRYTTPRQIISCG